MNEYIYNQLDKYEEIRSEAAERCLDAMFRLAQPSTTFAEIREQGKTEGDPREKNEILHQDRYYLPIEIQKEISDHYKDAYGISSQWPDHFDLVKKYIFEGGYKAVPKTEENWAGMEKIGPLELSKKDMEALEKRMDDCRGFYRLNGAENQFAWEMLNYSPNSNPKTVEEYWRSHGKPEFTIDESIYSEDYTEPDGYTEPEEE